MIEHTPEVVSSSITWIHYIASMIGVGGITAIISALVNREKLKEEIKKLATQREIEIGQMGLQYADRFTADIDKMRCRITELENQCDTMKLELSKLKEENIKLRLLVKTLINRLKPHEDELTISQIVQDLEVNLSIKEDTDVRDIS